MLSVKFYFLGIFVKRIGGKAEINKAHDEDFFPINSVSVVIITNNAMTVNDMFHLMVVVTIILIINIFTVIIIDIRNVIKGYW